MKSFAAKVRDSLTRDGERAPDTTGSRRAELTGLFLACGMMTLAGGGRVRLSMRTEHAGCGRRIVRLLRKEFSVSPGLRILRASRLGGKTTFEIRLETDDAARVMKACDLSPLDLTIPRHCLKNRRSGDAFLRGMFLGCGTMNNPSKGYRLEFVVSNEKTAKSLVKFLRAHCAVQPLVHERKQTHIVYLNSGDDIITVLSSIGAYSAILELENIRITKDARNRANRAANCDSGNITKMLGAADRQLQAIDRIDQTIGLDALPDTLREIAIERRQHADISLEALGAMLEPPVGKSGVYHRLSRIEALARSIVEKEEEGGL